MRIVSHCFLLMLVVFSDKHRLHSPELFFAMGRMSKYPDQPSRADSILSAIQGRKIGTIVKPENFGLGPIEQIHSEAYINYLKVAYEEWIMKGGDENGVIPDTFAVNISKQERERTLNGDNTLAKMGIFTFDTATVIAQGTFEAAYEAVQVALTASKLLMENNFGSTYALCRPPGHHASQELLGGFCFFNNAAIAAKYLITEYNKRVCVLDIDYHHGNGTQTIFYDQANPLVISLHAEDSDPYFWGHTKEIGSGQGAGYNLNIVLPDGTGDEQYLSSLHKVITKSVLPYKPDVVVVSLGVDTYIDDPLGTFNITANGFTKIGSLLRTMGIPCVFVQEGGYDSPDLGLIVTNVLNGFETVKYKR